MANRVSFLQINLRSCRAATDNLVRHAAVNGLDILLVQDPYSNGKIIPGIPVAWRTVLSKKCTAGIIVINPSLDITISLRGDNYVVINLAIDKGIVNIISQYTRPKGDLAEDLVGWKNAFRFSTKLIIGGDFNAHGTAWGYEENDERGETIYDLIQELDLTLINDPDCPFTYFSPIGKGRPDLTLMSSTLTDYLLSWNVSLKHTASDHR